MNISVDQEGCRFRAIPFVVLAGIAIGAVRKVKERTMAKYLLVYHGGSGMAESAEEQAAAMTAWNDWFGRLDGALVDGGNPTAAVKRVSSNGSVSDDPSGPTGYSIISASSLDEAVVLAKGSPLLKAGGTIQVAEAIDM